jgi:hypothetical protein
MTLLKRPKSDDQFRAAGDTIAIRMMLVECLRQIALTKADPDVFLAGIKEDLISRAKQLDALADDKHNIVPMQVAAAINLVFDIATAKVHSDGHAIARNGAADGSEGPQAR